MRVSCHYLLTTCTTLKDLLDGVKIELETISSSYELAIEEVPSLHDIFPKLGVETDRDPFTPFNTDYKPKPDEIAMYVHSSGSTGLPKAIPYEHQTLLYLTSICKSFDIIFFELKRLNPPPAPTIIFRDHTPRLRMAAMHLPPFHTLGIFAQLLLPLFGCTTVAVYPPVVGSPESLPILPTPNNVLDHIQRTKSNALMAIPTLLQIWSQDQKAVEILSALQFVVRFDPVSVDQKRTI